MSAKKCIFCSNTGMTKEHFWPDWMRQHIGVSESDTYKRSILTSDSKKPVKLKKESLKPGNLLSLKIRVVCAGCNNGWMSELENDMKPFLLSAIEGKDAELQDTDIEKLARWIVMKVIVLEHSEEGTQVTPKDERIKLRESLEIPKYFRVYLGTHGSSRYADALKHTLTLSASKDGPTTGMQGMQCNTIAVSFFVGPLFIYVFACREKFEGMLSIMRLNQMRCIFPNKKRRLRLHNLKEIDGKRISHISNALTLITQSKLVPHLGPVPSN